MIGGAYAGAPQVDGDPWDFTLVFFRTNLSSIGIEHIPWVMVPPPNSDQKYHIQFTKTQHGLIDTREPGFLVDNATTEGGNSGGPIMLPLPSGDLAFIGGITTVQMTGQATNNIQEALSALQSYFSTNTAQFDGSLSSQDFELNWYTP